MAHVLVLASISESLVNSISHFVRDAGLPGIFALMAISSACIPIPSEVVMLFAGFAVADPTQSAAHHHMTMTGVVLAGLLGTMVGSWIAYGIGRGGRLELFERHGAKLHMGPAQIQRADRFFQRYGEQTVLFGRMIPLVRAFVSLPAGVARMPLGRFTLFSLLGTIPWVLALAFAGHALGSDWTTVRKGFEYLDYVIVLLIVAGIVYAVMRRRSRPTGRGGRGERAGGRRQLTRARMPDSVRELPLRHAVVLGLLARPDRAAADLLLGTHNAHPLAGRVALWPARPKTAQVFRGGAARRHSGSFALAGAIGGPCARPRHGQYNGL